MKSSKEKKSLLSVFFVFFIGFIGIMIFFSGEKSDSPSGLLSQKTYYGRIGECFCKTDYSTYWESGAKMNIDEAALIFIGYETKYSCADKCKKYCPYGVCKGTYYLFKVN
jgi:hypothetical protein